MAAEMGSGSLQNHTTGEDPGALNTVLPDVCWVGERWGWNTKVKAQPLNKLLV